MGVISEDKSYLEYLHQILGVQYLPLSLPWSSSSGFSSLHPQKINERQAEKHVVWQKPAFQPQIIFLNQDSASNLEEASLKNLFLNIVKAIGFQPDEVWYVESQNRSLMDFLSWLKSHHLVAPLVVMRADPEIKLEVQNAGVFNWVECFSLGSMESQPQLKKPTWEVLKLLQKASLGEKQRMENK